MANLYQNVAPTSPVSEIGDDAGVSSGFADIGADKGKARVRTLPSVKTRLGRGPVSVDSRKYKYDVITGMKKPVSYAVSKDDRMSAEEAGGMLHAIHEMFGISTELEHSLLAFDRALWLCHTVNSGSVLQPGRAKMYVAGQEFDFMQVVKKLGVDVRRFFRAYADDIAEVNRDVLAAYDPYDPVSVELHGWISQVASERGLHRYPHLCHDSADACLRLNQTERAALALSKKTVIASVYNSADRMNANSNVQSAEGFDSTTGTVFGSK